MPERRVKPGRDDGKNVKKKKEISGAKDLTRGLTGGADRGIDPGSADKGDFVNRDSTTAEFAEKSESGTAGTELPASGRDDYPGKRIRPSPTWTTNSTTSTPSRSSWTAITRSTPRYRRTGFYGRFASAYLDGGRLGPLRDRELRHASACGLSGRLDRTRCFPRPTPGYPPTASSWNITTWSSHGPVRRWHWISPRRGPPSWLVNR